MQELILCKINALLLWLVSSCDSTHTQLENLTIFKLAHVKPVTIVLTRRSSIALARIVFVIFADGLLEPMFSDNALFKEVMEPFSIFCPSLPNLSCMLLTLPTRNRRGFLQFKIYVKADSLQEKWYNCISTWLTLQNCFICSLQRMITTCHSVVLMILKVQISRSFRLFSWQNCLQPFPSM